MTAHTDDDQSRTRQEELTGLLGEAEKVPGVAELMKLYNRYQKAVPQPVTKVRYGTGGNA